MDQQRCRCCAATKSEHYYDLFEKYKTTRTYAENIHHIADVDVELDDGLPQYACGDCFSELQNVIEFALIIRQTDEKLRLELQPERQTSVVRKSMDEGKSVQLFEDYPEDMRVCIVKEEVLNGKENLHQQAEMTIGEEYVKYEIFEYDEEVPINSIEHMLPKENHLLQELAQVAVSQENVQVHDQNQNQDQDLDSHQDFHYPEDECDDEFLIEYNPAEETHYNFKPPKWKCVECKIILRGDVSHEGHMNIHKKIKPHKCPQCRCQFRCRNSLKKHKEARHTTELSAQNTKLEEVSLVHTKCIDCNVEFQTEIDLLKHESIAHDRHSQTTSCPFCPDVIVDNLLNHLQSAHLDQAPYPPKDDDDDDDRETLLVPIPSKTNCSLSALTGRRKITHNVIAEADRKQMLKSPTTVTSWHCDVCLTSYRSLAALNHHRKLSHGSDDCHTNMLDSIVHCKICKKKMQKKSLYRHMALHECKEGEEQTKKLLCAYCPREFNYSKSLKKHEKTHRGKAADTVYVCGDCDRQYSSQLLLETHRRQAHKDRYNVCPICGNAFKLKNHLAYHMKLHLGKTIQCPHCDKKYARQSELNVHLRSHTGEMPYECYLCDKRFAIKVRLTYHLQKHYGIKHQCNECHAEFNSRQKLKDHSFKHTGMPYRCELCEDRGFFGRAVFRNHLDRFHNTSMTDEALNEMFQRNTGKMIKIKEVSEPNVVPSPKNHGITKKKY